MAAVCSPSDKGIGGAIAFAVVVGSEIAELVLAVSLESCVVDVPPPPLVVDTTPSAVVVAPPPLLIVVVSDPPPSAAVVAPPLKLVLNAVSVDEEVKVLVVAVCTVVE